MDILLLRQSEFDWRQILTVLDSATAVPPGRAACPINGDRAFFFPSPLSITLFMYVVLEKPDLRAKGGG